MKKGKFKGMKKEIRGFWVDVVNSPYMSFGVDVDRVSVSVSRPHHFIDMCYVNIFYVCILQSTQYSSGLFDVQNEGSGVEQHRHVSLCPPIVFSSFSDDNILVLFCAAYSGGVSVQHVVVSMGNRDGRALRHDTGA